MSAWIETVQIPVNFRRVVGTGRTLMSAWIETVIPPVVCWVLAGRTLMSAWIETAQVSVSFFVWRGRTLMSAWIETFCQYGGMQGPSGSHSHECVD